MLNNYVHKL